MITVSGLTKHYGDRVAVDDVSFVVGSGRVTGFVGPNGAGKSTTMAMMVGLTRPTLGSVSYAGVEYTDLAHPACVVGSVLTAESMHPGRTARNHLRTLAALSGISTERVDSVLAEVGLLTAANQRAGTFSLGMRQRLALAGALLGEPEVLLLDEPANGLDPDGIRWLRTYLRAFADNGGAVFVSSHLIAELAMFVDDLVVIGVGRLLAVDTIEGITAANETTVLVGTPNMTEFTTLLESCGLLTKPIGNRLAIRGTTRSAVAHLAFEHRILLDELTESSKSLEDSLIDLTSQTAEFASA